MRNGQVGFKNHTNEDIDITRSKYNILGYRDAASGKSIYDLVSERLEKDFKGQRKLRKDAVVLREVVIQASSNIYDGMTVEEKQEKTREFIKDALPWFGEEFGAENIIGYGGHLDETNPHVHIMVMPMTKDGRISQKDFFKGPKDLKRQHREFREHMNGRGWEFELENKRENVDGLPLPKYKANAKEIEKKREEQQEMLEELESDPDLNEIALDNIAKKLEDEYQERMEEMEEEVYVARSRLVDKIELELKAKVQEIEQREEAVCSREAEVNVKALRVDEVASCGTAIALAVLEGDPNARASYEFIREKGVENIKLDYVVDVLSQSIDGIPFRPQSNLPKSSKQRIVRERNHQKRKSVEVEDDGPDF